MAHSLVKVYIHYVWTTKNRERMLGGDARRAAKEHMAAYAGENKIVLEEFDIQPEHVHVLIRLVHDQRIEDVSKMLKGESSHWINQNDIVSGKFSWQRGYAAFSVGHESLGAVKQYIMNQDEHHQRKSFTEELETMLQGAGYSDEDVAETLKM